MLLLDDHLIVAFLKKLNYLHKFPLVIYYLTPLNNYILKEDKESTYDKSNIYFKQNEDYYLAT